MEAPQLLGSTFGRLSEARDWLNDRLTPTVARAKLAAVAAMLNYRPSLRHHLRDTHPLGVPFVFEAKIQLLTWDRSQGVHAIFEGGRMRVGSGPLPGADVTVRFRRLEHMRAFFTPGTDTLSMILTNDVAIEGNVAYLAKFGYLTSVIETGGKARRPEGGASAKGKGPARWQDLEAYPAGEPCRDRPAGEVTHLADPYLAGYTLDDFPRLKRLLWSFRTVTPEFCSERARLLTEFMLQDRMRRGGNGRGGNGRSGPALDGKLRWTSHQSDGPGSAAVGLRQARALRYVMTRKQARINDDDLLAGTTTAHRIGVQVYPELGGTWMWPELLTMEVRKLNPYRISDEEIEILNRQVYPFWLQENVRDRAYLQNGRPRSIDLDSRFALYFMWKTQAVSHTVADVPRVLRLGLRGIRDEAREREEKAADDPARRDFYRSLQIATEGVMDYAHRLARLASEEADAIDPTDEESRARRHELRL
ncbi:pyruvate formate lyase family protein, partial [Myxococcota bacterium]